jgi:hypothetical protein
MLKLVGLMSFTLKGEKRMRVSINWYLALVCALALAAGSLRAEEQAATAEAITATASDSKVIGYVDLRPTWTTQSGGVGTENAVRLGYQFNKDRNLFLHQDFYTNVYTPKSETRKGIKPTLDNLYLAYTLSNLIEDKDAGISFTYQPRLYAPTSEASGKAGLIAYNRNNLVLAKKFNESVSVSLAEIPILQVHQNGGYINEGVPTANPFFENRVYLIADVNLTKDLSLSVPLMFYQTRYSNYQSGALNNNSWTFALYTWPELIYAVDANTSVGVAYYNNKSFFTPDLAKAQIGTALESGAIQAVLHYTL